MNARPKQLLLDSPHGNGDDLRLALQIILVTIWSGLVAQLNRWRRHPRPWRLCLWCLLVDVVSCSLVGFSVWLLAEREGLGYYESLWAAIVAGHFGARWFGLLIHSSRG
ncbi:hypothetical protein [Methylococcus capsulatus]|jgi:hypothetical protein|uniref:Holin n=1 Tax=Methylococcus capsulatus TaxID=414 RepID=A0AA35UI66_METCP|nr:hypothetical protein [Methylococcus capsulatus]QXP89562.1 hypothetical protein KW114_10645 [Methylococcus capsulatus]CAI8818905.1 membrane protein of unknown function [Methylococcus capsulatus]